ELDRRAGVLAEVLAARGAGPGTVVAVLMERSAELVAALLAVWKTGAAYLPVDPGYPAERIGYMLADAAPVCVLAGDGVSPEAVPGGLAVSAAAAEAGAPAPGAGRVRPGDLAYVIYTSGSTGTPAGV